MSIFYAISASTLLVIAIVTFVMGDYETARHTVVCSLLFQILMKLEEKSDG